ncbi:hypothetical protein I302_103646 [Kwoniella bestiolae CBS 10118]|uniref:Uncharacterized protein n=1 Tax=Kwoniella bestiolae CBS 10118 TaxID=1296100 RepID=A0A1B9G919_9TREE|nr:hypothetical protein I302_02351 [Kwoniella bestiolae CBS 10118]OCF27509.1 hypothetical protein I302_02351 [Kwoniella bestiolae CBS 10118]
MSSPFRLAPMRNRSQTQSHIPYKPVPDFSSDSSTGWRGGEIQRKWFLLVIYGPDFIVDGSSRMECDENEEGGSLLVILQPTVHQQLIHLISQIHLPSPLGLSLHLNVPDAPHKPKLTDILWPTFFSSYLLPSHSQNHESIGNLPIVATVTLRIDKRAARWYEGWKRDPQDGKIGKWVDTRHLQPIPLLRREVSLNQIQTIVNHTREASNQFTDSPFDLSVDSIVLPEQEDRPTDPVKMDDSTRPPTVKDQPDLPSQNLAVPSEEVKTITLPPLSAFSSPTLPNPQNQISSGSSTPLSFHSIPYSPIHTLPDPQALATQPFLKELYQRINITHRVRSNSDLAQRRGREGLTIDTQKPIKAPWADLGSAMWSQGTSWGPATTPEGWDLSPSQRQVNKQELVWDSLEKERENGSLSTDGQHQVDFTVPPIPSSGRLDGSPDNLNDGDTWNQQHHYGSWTFLPKGPVTPTPWKFGWPFHEIVALPPPRIDDHANHPSIEIPQDDLNVCAQVEVERVIVEPAEIDDNVAMNEFAQQIEFFESQSQVINHQLQYLQISPLPLESTSIVTPAFELDTPTFSEGEIEEGFEFEETFPPTLNSSLEIVDSPVEEITLQVSSPQGLPEDMFPPLERCPRPADQHYSQASTSFLQPYVGRIGREYDPISPFDLDIPFSPFEEEDEDDDDRMDYAASDMRRSSVLGFEGSTLDVIEEVSNSDISSPRSVKVSSPGFSPSSEDEEMVEDVADSQWNTGAMEEIATSANTGFVELPKIHEEDQCLSNPASSATTGRVLPRLPTPHTRLSSYLLEEDQPPPASELESPVQHHQEGLSSPAPFVDCIDEDLASPRSDLFQYTNQTDDNQDVVEDTRPSRSSLVGSIKPLFRSRSQKDRSRSSAHTDIPSFMSHHEQAHTSTTSLTSTNASTTAPKRPLKKLSQRLSGFGDCPEGGGREIPLLAEEGRMTNSTSFGSYTDGFLYPNLVIYPPMEKQRIRISVHQEIYPNLIIYKPASGFTMNLSRRRSQNQSSSQSSKLIKLSIDLVEYHYPNIIVYPSSSSKASPVLTKTSKPIRILTREFAYPNLEIYPTVIPIQLVKYEYPNVLLYPSTSSTRPRSRSSIRSKTIEPNPVPILLCQSVYPDLKVYPKVIPVQLVRCRYPDLVIYPCCNKGISKIKDELMTERRYQATKYPLDPTDPKELLLNARRRYLNLKASLELDREHIHQRISSVKRFHHQRGSSSISSASSSALVTPVLELPPFSVDDLNVPKKIDVPAETGGVTSKATVPSYFSDIMTSPASTAKTQTGKDEKGDGARDQSEIEDKKRRRSGTLISERMKAFSSPQDPTPFSPPPVAERSRSSTHNDVDKPQYLDSPFSLEIRGKEAEDGKRVGRLSKDLMKKWV